MSWENILKMVRTNDVKEWSQDFVLLDEVWVKAGGASPEHIPESEGGHKFMTIDDVEETLGRKLTWEDFSHVPVNWNSNDPQVIDRIGQEGLEELAEDYLNQMVGEATGRLPMYYDFKDNWEEVIVWLNKIIKKFPNTDIGEIAQTWKKRAERKMKAPNWKPK